MRHVIEIEDIEEKRRIAGIDDVDLRQEIRGLRVGDVVNLTFVAGSHAFETLLVRIASIRGSAFRGNVANVPSAAGLSTLRVGSSFAFTAAHIHSLPRKRPTHGL